MRLETWNCTSSVESSVIMNTAMVASLSGLRIISSTSDDASDASDVSDASDAIVVGGERVRRERRGEEV